MRLLTFLFLTCCVVSVAASAATTSVTSFPAGFPNLADQPEGWVVAPPGRPFPSILSDLRDLRTSLRKNNKKEIEADVGNYRSLAGWKGDVHGKTTVFHTGIEGNGYFVMRQEDQRFPLQSSDGLIGVYGEAVRGEDMFQFRFTHISAHLSDGLFGVRNRIVYTREFASLRYARQWGFTRPYIGYSVLVHTKPELPRHSGQVGFYSIFPAHWGAMHPYFGTDLKIHGQEEGTTFNISGGIAIVSSLGAPPLRVVANYLKGHDLRGQFFNEKTEKFSAGIELDL